MTNQEILELFKPLVEFLGEILGNNTEVLLHDLSQPEHSVVAISHGFNSGREIGSSITDLALSVKNNKQYQKLNFLANYRANSKGKEYISSTYYIKNNGELIGMLCMNTNIGATQDFINASKQLIASTNLFSFLEEPVQKTDAIRENLDIPIVSFADSIISKTIAEFGIDAMHMTRDEKKQVVSALNAQGIPRMKGAITQIAKQLKMSESTVYRYISEAK